MVTVYGAYKNYERTMAHLRSLGLDGHLSKAQYVIPYDYDDRREWDDLRPLPTQKLDKPLTFIKFDKEN